MFLAFPRPQNILNHVFGNQTPADFAVILVHRDMSSQKFQHSSITLLAQLSQLPCSYILPCTLLSTAAGRALRVSALVTRGAWAATGIVGVVASFMFLAYPSPLLCCDLCACLMHYFYFAPIYLLLSQLPWHAHAYYFSGFYIFMSTASRGLALQCSSYPRRAWAATGITACAFPTEPSLDDLGLSSDRF